MLLKLLAIIWIVTGILCLIWPERFRKRLERQGKKKIKRILFAVSLFLSGLFIGAAWEFEGWLRWALIGVGVIGLIKGFIFLKGRTGELLTQWLMGLSAKMLRILSSIQLGLGVLMYIIPSLMTAS